jgi:hypothetical protein
MPGGQAAEQVVQLRSLGGVQLSADLFFMRGTDDGEFLHEPGALVGEIEGVVAAVADVTLPVGRFAGLLWLVAVSLLLPRSRKALRTPAAG